MSGRPILLKLPETLYYYGQYSHQVFEGFSRVVSAPDEIAAAISDALQMRPLSEDENRALTDWFGPPDGESSARLLRETMRRSPNRPLPTSVYSP